MTYYYRWLPKDLGHGLYDSPVFGHLIPGRVIEVPEGRADQLSVVAADPAFVRVEQDDFDRQPTLDDELAQLQVPARKEQ